MIKRWLLHWKTIALLHHKYVVFDGCLHGLESIFVVRLLIRMWNVDQSYKTIILNLMLSRIAGQIASRMKYLRNAGKFAKCGTITQNAWQVATLTEAKNSIKYDGYWLSIIYLFPLFNCLFSRCHVTTEYRNLLICVCNNTLK